MKIRYIFFDVGWTVFDKPRLIEALCQVISSFGYKTSTDEIYRVRKKMLEDIFVPVDTTPKFYKDFNSKMLKSLNVPAHKEILENIEIAIRDMKWEPYSDTKILSEIKLPKGIISNWKKGLISDIENYFPGMFHPVIGSGDIGVSKPDLKIFQKAIETIGIEAENCLFIGDSLNLDIIPARALGMTAILIDRHGFFTEYKGQKIKTLTEVINFF